MRILHRRASRLLRVHRLLGHIRVALEPFSFKVSPAILCIEVPPIIRLGRKGLSASPRHHVSRLLAVLRLS